MEVTATVSEYLDKMVSESGEFQEDWTKIREYRQMKLWHQLTLKLQSCFENPRFKSQTDLIKLNDVFLSDFRSKVNPLALAELSVSISEQMVVSDPHQGIKYMEEIRDKYSGKSKEAAILCNTAIGMIHLTTLNDLVTARQVIETTGEQLEQLGGVTCVHARFYQLSSRYYQITGQHAEYYREALRFLGCVRLEDLSLTDQRAWAFSVGLAAILGEGVYNFGQLLLHDVLSSLKDSPESWLIDLLLAFNRGDLNQLEQLRPRWSIQPDLVAAEPRLRDKVTLLSLAEMVFRRPVHKRCLAFTEISQVTRVPVEQMELFLMRALSIGLIKGRIDEASQTISISWLQPRVLDREQIGSMRARLTEWCSSVTDTKNFIEADTQTILA